MTPADLLSLLWFFSPLLHILYKCSWNNCHSKVPLHRKGRYPCGSKGSCIVLLGEMVQGNFKGDAAAEIQKPDDFRRADELSLDPDLRKPFWLRSKRKQVEVYLNYLLGLPKMRPSQQIDPIYSSFTL